MSFVLWSSCQPAAAVERIYNVVTNQSSIAISGTVTSSSLGTAPIAQQGPGSLVTSYTGTIRTDRGANTVQFLGGSAVDANVSGNWAPLADGSNGTAPADYGGRVTFNLFATLYFAARDAVGDLTSDALPVNGGNFDLSAVTLTFVNGSIAYRDSPFGLEPGVRPLIGESGTLDGTGSLTTQMQAGGILETLLIPVNSAVMVATGDGSINLTLTGQVMATALLPAQPPGDYNQNGTVDAADYVVWRKNLGSGTALPNDGTPGVGPDDYDRWRMNFGQSTGGGSAARLQAVPEPEFAPLLLMGLVAGLAARRRPSQNRPHARRVLLRGVCRRGRGPATAATRPH